MFKDDWTTKYAFILHFKTVPKVQNKCLICSEFVVLVKIGNIKCQSVTKLKNLIYSHKIIINAQALKTNSCYFSIMVLVYPDVCKQ